MNKMPSLPRVGAQFSFTASDKGIDDDCGGRELPRFEGGGARVVLGKEDGADETDDVEVDEAPARTMVTSVGLEPT